MMLFTGNNLARPIKDSPKLHDIRVAQFYQLFGCLFTASAAAAIHHDELILIGQFGDLGSTDGFVWNVDGIRNMPAGKLIDTAPSWQQPRPY